MPSFEGFPVSTMPFVNPEVRRHEAAGHPIISGTKFELGKMAVTLAFNSRSPTAKHASLFFERRNADGTYEYSGIHLCGASESSGSGGTARIEKIEDSERVLQSVNGKFELRREPGGRNRWVQAKPHYDCLASFVVEDNMDEILTKVDDDANSIQFSLLADFWDSNTYNCCSYAHRVLGYCGISIPYEYTRGSVPFWATHNDNGFIEATVKYYKEQKRKLAKLHVIAKERCDTLFTHDNRVAVVESVGRVVIGGGVGIGTGYVVGKLLPAESEEERNKTVKTLMICFGIGGAVAGFIYDLYIKDCENHRTTMAKRCVPLARQGQ